MKSPITTCLILAFSLPVTALPAIAPADYVYPDGPATTLRLGSDLFGILDSQFQKQLCPQPICIESGDSPVIVPTGSTSANAALGKVFISAGLIDMLNHIAHAKAIDHIQHGFFQQYVRALGDALQAPAIDDPRFWRDDVIDDQASYFNQMIGALTAINLSQNYLGYVTKYSGRMPPGKLAPINGLLAADEWESSVKAGMHNALDCALATDGIKALFEAIEMMPKRAAWTAYIVPAHIDIKKLNKELVRYEYEFFRGQVK